MSNTRRHTLATLVVLALAVSACGGGDEAANGDSPAAGGDSPAAGGDSPAAGETGGDAGGAVAESVDLSGVSITVGSKEFTEQQVVGQIALQALQAAGAEASDQTGLSGTEVVRSALESGEIDTYWEYTGTGWITILGETEILESPEAYYEQVAEADMANGIVWLEPSEVNNTYAFFTGPNADLGVSTISELAELANSEPDRVTLCAATEFVTRDDGLPGVTETYGFEFSAVSELDLSLAIQAAIEGTECTVGEIFQTDPQIIANDLTVLEDDQAFFPAYNLALTIREDVYSENAEAYDTLFGAITELLTNESMIELNGRVDVDGESPEDVARDFLVENGIISG